MPINCILHLFFYLPRLTHSVIVSVGNSSETKSPIAPVSFLKGSSCPFSITATMESVSCNSRKILYTVMNKLFLLINI